MNKNQLLLRLFADKKRYADLINGYAGAQVVREEDLSELDSISHVFSDFRKERYRDLIRRSAYGMNFAIIGIENQSEVHYLMPLRTMSYDVAEYEKQAYLIGQNVKKQKGLTSAEFLSRFRKEDRLHPCITLVLYWGEKWDGPTDLHDILNFESIPPELKKMVNHYPLHLIDMNQFEHTDAFETDLKQIFDFIRHSRNGMQLKELFQADAAYQNLDEAAYDVIAAFTNATELEQIKPELKEGGNVDMCEGIRQLIEEGRNEGIDTAFEIIRKLKLGITPEELIAQGTDEAVVLQALTLV